MVPERKEGEPRKLPVTPTLEQWRAMTPEARERFQIEANEALSDPRRLMSEGMPHRKAKGRVIDMLGLHFRSIGRIIFLAEELSVLYPGEEVFTPDILAVADVPQVEDDERLSWVVANEGRGLDFVLEVLHHGDRKKDLVDNVERYARLGIPEYFIYDRARQRIHGYRLPASGTKPYERIVPQLGRYGSTVLGVDMALQDGRIVFFHGMAEIFGTAELLGRLRGMMDSLEEKAEQAEAQAQQAQAQAQQALRNAVLALLASRGIALSEEASARVSACEDPAVLSQWLLRAVSAGSAAELFDEKEKRG